MSARRIVRAAAHTINRSAALVTLAAAAAGAQAPAAPAAAAPASAVAGHIKLGDSESAAHNVTAALGHYTAAIKVDSTSYEAQWKASREAAEAGEAATDAGQKKTLYRDAERYARTAVRLNPTDAEGHAALARALGRTALTLGTRDRVKYAADVRNEAMAALKYDPRHAAALHIMGMWNAEIMRLNGMARFMAKNFLGGKVFGTASWNDAKKYMEEAVAVDPTRLVHRIDLAQIYADAGDKAKAKETFEFVASAPATDPADVRYKQQAQRALKAR